MVKHRSLSNALLTPEKIAFIKGEETDSGRIQKNDPSKREAPSDPATDLRSVEPNNVSQNIQPSRQTSATNDNALATTMASDDNDAYRVAITTRLTPQTAEALRRAYLEQKLNRRKPATQQEIVEAAVRGWLREHSYTD